ncbi:nitroreductase family protein [Paenibacillus tyrfis]|uniref:Putative NAD(P)H nitroreductase n=1 Tax=Paenibacillus tyrfis TaxID=1501230 RepID=A0A081NWE6_9BACL|nr:nitroreductase [Paenibacillus tyrfis]KEQ22769.1 hypothetical protein ET33_20655 [Paenibacillus tyrfis]
MELAQAIRERRTVLRFNDTPVPRQLLIDMLNDAVWAPNHGMREPWRFVEIKRETIEPMCRLIADWYQKNNRYTEEQIERWYETVIRVPAYLVVVAKKSDDLKIWEEDYAAVCCLIQNIQLLGWERGVGMVWATNDFIDCDEYREFLQIKSDEKIVGVLNMGFFDREPKPRPRTPAEKKLTSL